MVEHCDILLAVWDGIKSGGVWSTIKFKKAKFIGKNGSFHTGRKYFINITYDDYNNGYHVEEWLTKSSYFYNSWMELEEDWILYNDNYRENEIKYW